MLICSNLLLATCCHGFAGVYISDGVLSKSARPLRNPVNLHFRHAAISVNFQEIPDVR